MLLYFSTEITFIDLFAFFESKLLFLFFVLLTQKSLFLWVFWFCPFTWIYTVEAGTHLKYKCKKKKNKQKRNQESCILCSIFSYVSLAEKVKTHVILESLTPRRDKYEKAKEKAVDSYVRKNKREKGKKRHLETCHISQMIP